ncbi:hypothetical protein PDE_00620 [Penicillium oxalicum 114-2]|uniref:UBC core domain-containing protein n=1 Tax=Penicillium oxalicum (strain 114-2 / CGMCC 5302) TaxID=933388 RepID=S7ZAH2_PENO1|nr:hypothetical protein PDE_00620 [Penicillium oxalicum 114-2]
MMSNLRRLTADHAALHGDRLPPYYLLPPDDTHFASADDLSQLNILITGPPGTPYSEGLWRLHLKIPKDYPKSPPKAVFRTKIWHPNVEEMTGAVCVDTLKRDWQSKLTLRDVLVTISCLLIHPNPDSALNATAGTLLREDFSAFAHQAKLLTSIHAPIQPAMRAAVKRARDRGEESASSLLDGEDVRDSRPRKQPRLALSGARQTTDRESLPENPFRSNAGSSSQATAPDAHRHSGLDDAVMADIESDTECLSGSSKENVPCSDVPTPLRAPPPTPVRSSPIKRPLSVIATSDPDDSDVERVLVRDSSEYSESEDETGYMAPSARNIRANVASSRLSPSPRRAAPMMDFSRERSSPLRLRGTRQIREEVVPDRTRSNTGGKENRDTTGFGAKIPLRTSTTPFTSSPNSSAPSSVENPFVVPLPPPVRETTRKPSKVEGNQKKAALPRNGAGPKSKGRMGVRRL